MKVEGRCHCGQISYEATVHADGRAAIAYELASPYWGRGLARRAVQAMIKELVETYGVLRLSAVLRRENKRSLRFLERLGFVPASVEEHAQHGVERGEILMHRDARSGSVV